MTMIIYGIQLFLSIKNFRKNIDDLYTKYSAEPDLCKKLTKREIIRKNSQYPSYLLLYLLGGFFICFHMILLFSITIKNVFLFFTFTGASTGSIGYIIPILVLYLLQKIIIRWIHKIFDHIDQRYENDSNLKLNIFDSILLYLKLISCKKKFSFIEIYSTKKTYHVGSFIGVVASIIRLIFTVLVNVIFMPRIDYSYLVEPLSGLGKFTDKIVLEMSKIILDV
jgi:hypothetical protein